MSKQFFTLLVMVFTLSVQAQIKNTDVLFSVEDEPVYAEEFIRIFNKNLDLVKDESQKDVDQYLKLFVNYKLKLKEAKALGLDKKPSYKRELDNYRTQLAKNYLTDTKVTDELVEEAYERISYDVNASHMLFKISENANPQDTLVAYNKMIQLRERVINEGFDKVKKEFQDRSKTIIAEDLGYFSGFKMVYDFENAAFNTEVGEVSQPFKTQFGYHIVTIIDKRESRGERTVAHIMINNIQKDTLKDKPEIRINDIYKKLQQGEDFESLAKQFSEDASSASKGGHLASFKGGQLSSTEFEDVAFDLNNIGDISQPFKTNFGWHIVKLYAKKPIESFEKIKSELQAKVKRDSRSKLINKSLIKSLKERYNVSDEQPALPYFISILNDSFYKQLWTVPNDFEGTQPLVKIGDKQLTYMDFGDYLVKSQRRAKIRKPFNDIVEDNYEVFLSNHLKQYREDHLEIENKDFSNIVGEYRDGLLLFDLMETEIWNVAKSDSIGLHKFYDSHKENYFWDERVDAVVASSANKSTIKKVIKLMNNGKTSSQIKESVNTNGIVDVIFTSGLMDSEHQALPNNFVFEKGVSKIYKHNEAFVVIKVNEILPKTSKAFDDAKGRIISDYQIDKENSWLLGLAEKYRVNINDEVLSKVKTQIEK